CIDPNLVLGINDSESNTVQSVNVFPNPVSNQLTISIQNDGMKECRLEIRNIVGQTVWTSLEQNVSAGVLRLDVDVKELASGMYSLRVADDQNARTVKFVKN
ncbi:MAG: T9SS type A sorting domain-containing protein, partial [Bacteroidota bacterium]